MDFCPTTEIGACGRTLPWMAMEFCAHRLAASVMDAVRKKPSFTFAPVPTILFSGVIVDGKYIPGAIKVKWKICH
jgi:hypothetical protein